MFANSAKTLPYFYNVNYAAERHLFIYSNSNFRHTYDVKTNTEMQV